jgi:hypothetical protein
MTANVPRYDRWKAPAEDGQTLIWPAPDQILHRCTENNQSLGHSPSVHLQNVPLAEVRNALRKSLGCEDDSQPIVATGHQAELHHAGVWVKNALIDVVGRKVGGRAIHFAVDTDEPKHLDLRWPGGSAALIPEQSSRTAWSGLLRPPTREQIDLIAGDFKAARKHWSLLAKSAGGHGALAGPSARDQHQQHGQEYLPMPPNDAAEINAALPAALTAALGELDGQLGLRYEAKLLGPLCDQEPYLLFVHHILSHASEFAVDYNAAIEEYRRENHIRTPGRPIPMLKADSQQVEVPFWLDDLRTGKRTRGMVLYSTDGFALQSASGRFICRADANGWKAAADLLRWLRAHNLRLSPRALTLTAVLRLLIADQFVHGIGGGQYDQVLDKLIWRHFRIEPPAFCVTTATMYFPDAVGQPRVCVPCIKQEGHWLRHGSLGEPKKELIAAIEAAPRNSLRRAELFAQMHQKLDAAGAVQIRQWEQRYNDALQKAQDQRIIFDRELFYAIQTRQRLEAMIEEYRTAFS